MGATALQVLALRLEVVVLHLKHAELVLSSSDSLLFHFQLSCRLSHFSLLRGQFLLDPLQLSLNALCVVNLKSELSLARLYCDSKLGSLLLQLSDCESLCSEQLFDLGQVFQCPLMLEEQVVVLSSGLLLDPLRLPVQLVQVVDAVFELHTRLHLALMLLHVPLELLLTPLPLAPLLLDLGLQVLCRHLQPLNLDLVGILN